MKEKVELLKGQIEKLKNIQKIQYGFSTIGVNAWISATVSILERIFGKESLKIQEIKSLGDYMITDLSGDPYYKINDVIVMGESIIHAAIDELEKLGIPSTIYDGKKDKINLTMIQQQSNLQNINIEIVTKALHDELNGNQLKDLQMVLDSKDDKEKKKAKLADKLEEFGINTISGVLSGILTNMFH